MPPNTNELNLGVSEFVALLNQTLDYAYPSLNITGELANLRVSKNKWLYFDLKDEMSSVKFFGTVYMLPGPLEDGMIVRVKGSPRLHNQYGFSVTVKSIQPAGEGSIKRAAELLEAKLYAEGLFDEKRKRPIAFPPVSIGLIASGQSAAYADFIKVLNARFGGIEIIHIDVQVQGDIAAGQIVAAIEQFNAMATPPQVLVIIRGGGSPEDMAAFNTEVLTRAVAASRVPTLVAIGHEVDVCLAELAADKRASTPSNAAELLVPERQAVANQLLADARQLEQHSRLVARAAAVSLKQRLAELQNIVIQKIDAERTHIKSSRQLLSALNPTNILQRGYAIMRQQNSVIRTVKSYNPRLATSVMLSDGVIEIKAPKEGEL